MNMKKSSIKNSIIKSTVKNGNKLYKKSVTGGNIAVKKKIRIPIKRLISVLSEKIFVFSSIAKTITPMINGTKKYCRPTS
jgi:hypothetical protein